MSESSSSQEQMEKNRNLVSGQVVAGAYGELLAPGSRAPAVYAASAITSRGREFNEPDCLTRGAFQRDRDRVIHASPFRRLTYKTQVFLFHEGDHYRTRLTHSLEVAQIARTLARQLRLDEDLAEVLALAHDLGHSPFGHAGERALAGVMAQFGGFDHNAQSLRIVARLERKYPNFDGLNLTWETLEGLAKHNGPVSDRSDAVARACRSLERWKSLELATFASGEAQVAALADDIAYVNHDIDDGLRAGLLKLEDLVNVPLAGPIAARVCGSGGGGFAVGASGHGSSPHAGGSSPKAGSDYDPAASYIDDSRAIYQLNRELIGALVGDCIAQTRCNLCALEPGSPDDIRYAGASVVTFSPGMTSDVLRLKAFLFENVYRHAKVTQVMDRAARVVEELFGTYFENPLEMHARWRQASRGLERRARARLVADFVSGMTDRLALKEHARLFGGSGEFDV